jgi:hypothetical protein
VSKTANESQSTVFGSRRADLIAFVVLLVLMLVASRRLEVYSRMPAVETGRNAVETTSFNRGLERNLSFTGGRDAP